MTQWAASCRFENVAFLCCCLDKRALPTALEFERAYFAGAPPSLLNAFIDDRADLPTFKTQLGCGGFAIFDAARNLKVPATLPWLQYRDGAFRDLEENLKFAMKKNKGKEKKKRNMSEMVALQDEEFNHEDVVVAVDSVGHHGVDEEHQRCTVALQSLQQTLTVASLQTVRSELVAHFHHEEELLREAGFGGATRDDQQSDASSMSAFGNHVKDHARIVGIADAALAKLEAACDRFEGAVPKAVAIGLAKAFVEHASLYDVLFAGEL